jgi:5-dehydro-2-deoxygluconokinase
VGAPRERLEPFKVLAVKAAAQVAWGRPGFGMLLHGIYGRQALFLASHYDFWLAGPVEKPGSRPPIFDGSLRLVLRISGTSCYPDGPA